MELINPNPVVYDVADMARPARPVDADPDAIDSFEVFDLIRGINDPEHPHTLEQLKVVQYDLLHVDNSSSKIDIQFTPTIPHCSMSTLIGLCIRVKLLRSLPPRFKVSVRVTPGTHNQEHDVNKQLNDKERVAAALENKHLIEVVNRCLATSVFRD
jgi:metal-sulfur cluster biosynthetic enzyme